MLASQLLTVMDGIRLRTPAPSTGIRKVMIDNLVFIHQVIVASEPLLREAIEYDDGCAGAELSTYLKQHLDEERDHALWLTTDLRAAGIDVDQRPLSIDAVEAVGAQYYLVRHAHPVALLGYMAFLECFPTSLAQVEWLEKVHGRELLRTLRFHAEHDPDHGADLIRLINSVPEPYRALVYNNGIRTAERFCAAASTFGKGD